MAFLVFSRRPWSHRSNCWETQTMKNDPALEAVRKARCDISREQGNDPARLVRHYTELQARFKGRIIQGPESDDHNREDTAQQAGAADGARSLAPLGSAHRG
jgi:hypothetical protein